MRNLLVESHLKLTSKYVFWPLPGLKLFYFKEFFLETGIYTPAVGLEFMWLVFHYTLIIQKGYE